MVQVKKCLWFREFPIENSTELPAFELIAEIWVDHVIHWVYFIQYTLLQASR